LTGLAAQRLLRKLCDKCAAENKSNKSIYEKKYEQLTCLEMPKHPVGCDKCNYTGYRGRVPILELLNINQEFSEAIRNEILSTGLRKIARKSGMRTLVELAKDSIAQGKTSVDEVFRVLGYELLETFDKS
jgi:type II secretory ATPase GspE/PulE/Tfp pilus assembly ATPase PilB-like protein